MKGISVPSMKLYLLGNMVPPQDILVLYYRLYRLWYTLWRLLNQKLQSTLDGALYHQVNVGSPSYRVQCHHLRILQCCTVPSMIHSTMGAAVLADKQYRQKYMESSRVNTVPSVD